MDAQPQNAADIILGVPVRPLTLAEAWHTLDRALELSRPTPVTFLNANTALLAARNPRLRDVLQRFTILNDGVGVDLGRRLKYGAPFPANLNGTDFIPSFLEKTQHKLRIFLLGARSDVVEDAALVLAYRYPRHRIVGFHSGYFPKSRTDEIVSLIREAKATVLLVAMGSERQEIWIAENFERTGAVLAFGVGAFFDFMAHRFPRAPRLVRTVRSEWIWRLMWEPERLWKRYTVGNVKFLAFAAKDALDHRLERSAEAKPEEVP